MRGDAAAAATAGASAGDPPRSAVIDWLSSTSNRTFVLWPAVIALEQAIARRPVRWRSVPLAVAGYAVYRLSGMYRTNRGGGGPGLKNPPERLVTSGVYALSRNPMYLGHLMCFAGMATATRSPLAAALLASHVPWFHQRAAGDEHGLEERFGEDYRRYRARVPRWLGVPRG